MPNGAYLGRAAGRTANSDARLSALRTSLWVVALFAVAAPFFTGLVPVKPIGRPQHDVATGVEPS